MEQSTNGEAGRPESRHEGGLETARTAFDTGDYRAVRAQARMALANADAPRAREEAETLLAATGRDRIAIILFGLCLAFLAVVAIVYEGQ